jgi:fucose permease
MTKPPTSRERLFAAACGGIFLVAIALALLGATLGMPEVRTRLNLSVGQQGELIFLLYFGLLPTALAAGPLLDRLGYKWVMAVSALLVAAALVLFPSTHSFRAAAFCVFLQGSGAGGLNTVTNTLVSDVFPEQRASRLNAFGMFFGLGGLFLPLLLATLAHWLPVNTAVWLASALAALVLGVYLTLGFPPAREAQGINWRDLAPVFASQGMLTLAVFVFFESGNEAVLGGFLTTYALSRRINASAASWALAGFWAALTLGRGASARLLRRHSKGSVMLGFSGLTLAGCLMLCLAATRPTLTVAAVVCGFGISAIFPTTLGLIGDRYLRFSGTVFGSLLAAALTGGMMLPWLVGMVAQRTSLPSALWIAVATSAIVLRLAMAVLRGGDGASPAEAPGHLPDPKRSAIILK